MLLGRKKYFLLKALQRIGLFPCHYSLPEHLEVDCSERSEADIKRLMDRHYDFINQSNQMLTVNPELLHRAAGSKFYSRSELLFNSLFCAIIFFVFLYSTFLHIKNNNLHFSIMGNAVVLASLFCHNMGNSRYNFMLHNEYKTYRRNPYNYLDNLAVSVNDFAVRRILGCSILMLLVAFAILTITVVLLVAVFLLD